MLEIKAGAMALPQAQACLLRRHDLVCTSSGLHYSESVSCLLSRGEVAHD